MGALYQITSPSGKSYIGITTFTSQERFEKHYSTRGRDFALCAAFRKYGKDEMRLETVCETDDWEMLCLLEMEHIAGRKTKYPAGYNMTDGGDGVPFRDEHQTERMLRAARRPERKEKISISTRARWSDPKYRERHTESLRKKHNDADFSEKRISALRKNLNERYADPKNREKVSKQFRGENNCSAKLTISDIYVIREMAANGIQQKEIAIKFGIHRSAVSLIHNRKNWAHLPELPEGLI